LDLPESIQQKIIDDKISSRNAQVLITLTREPLSLPSQRATVGFEAGEPQKGRTDKFYVEIEKVAEEIEKGSKGGLRLRKEIQDDVDAIQ